jgi:phosphoadenosine phosphosulfate reductase
VREKGSERSDLVTCEEFDQGAENDQEDGGGRCGSLRKRDKALANSLFVYREVVQMPALTSNPSEVAALAVEFEHASATEVLRWAVDRFGRYAAIGTSFQGAGLVTIHHAVAAGLPLPVFTIDTGLLFPETLELKTRLEEYFGIVIEGLVPERTVEQQAEDIAPELWLSNPDLCCTLRKVEPLQKKLNQLDAWIAGLRREQSAGRANVQVLELYEFDRLREKNILKVNPLVRWSRDEVWDYIRRHGIPYNPLMDRGFRSIGCYPCTRVVISGQDERAGRWTGFDKSECGIHTFLGDKI